MKTLSGYILTKILGWKIEGKFPDIKKSIVIFAPHTSYYDALYGKLLLNELGIEHKFLSKKELFFFPMNIFMRMYGSVPVRGIAGQNAIYQVVKILNGSQSLHIVLSPEGALAKTTRWDKGFYYMAHKAKVPVVVSYLDYHKKELGIRGVIRNLDNMNIVMDQINRMYSGVTAKYPESFSLDLTNKN